MPILYERTDRMVRHYGNKIVKLSPSPSIGWFIGGVFVGYFVLPIVLPIIGVKLWRWAAEK